MTMLGTIFFGTIGTAGALGYAALRMAGRSAPRAALGALLGVGFLFGAWVTMALYGQVVLGDIDTAGTGATVTLPFLLAGILWLLWRES